MNQPGIVNLIDGYFIEIDSLNFALKQKFVGKSKDGVNKVSIRTLGYYGKLPDALVAFVKTCRRDKIDGMEISLPECINLFKQSDKRIEDFCSKYDFHRE